MYYRSIFATLASILWGFAVGVVAILLGFIAEDQWAYGGHGSPVRMPSGYEAITRGLIYERIGDEIVNEPKFRYERTEELGAFGRRVTARYMDLNGKPLVSETTEYDSSGRFLRYTMDQKQIDFLGVMEVRGSKLHFSSRRPDGRGSYKTETAEEDLKENSVCVDQMIDYLKSNWEKIKAGEDIDVKFAVVSRLETVNFSLQKEDVIKNSKGAERLVIRLTPSNIFFRLFVNPLFLTFEMGGHRRVLEVRGRLPIKRFKDNDYSDIEGLMRLQYDDLDETR